VPWVVPGGAVGAAAVVLRRFSKAIVKSLIQ
jgi:hypothetical protein